MGRAPRVKDELRRVGIRPSKHRGQNFLIDESVLRQIVEFGRPQEAVQLIEIGPGLGALTRELAPFAPLVLIEIEQGFCRELESKYPGAEIINEDVRSVDFSEFKTGAVVFGNLPYAFSTDIVFHLLHYHAHLGRAVLLLQKEFAERLAAPPGGRDYGVLSIMSQLWAKIELGPIIPGDSFHPKANVDSRLVALQFLKASRTAMDDALWFRRVVQAGFSQRRRKLLNSLVGSNIATRAAITEALAAAGIDGNRRAETLSIEEFAALARSLPHPCVRAQPPR